MEISGALLGLILALVAFVYWKLTNAYSHFKKRGIPYVKPTYVLGSNVKGALLRQHVSESWAEMYYSLKPNKVGGFFQFTKPIYMALDPDYIQKIFISDFSHFVDRGFKVDEKTNPLEQHMFFLNGQKWRYIRAKLSPIFTSGKLKWMFEAMSNCGDALISHFDKLADGKERDLKDSLARFTTDVIGSCAFGFDSESLKNPDSKFRTMGRRLFDPSIIEGIKFFGRFTFPELFHALKVKTTPAEVSEFFTTVMKQTFEHRIKTGTQRKDIVQLLLQLREKGSVDIDEDQKEELENGHSMQNAMGDQTKFELTDSLLTAQSFVFFVAGFETTSTTMYFTLFYLSRYPEIQQKVRDEVRKVKGKHGCINYEALKDMEYLEKCISETLRLFPPVPHLNRECTKPYTFPNGMKIDKGELLIIPIYGLHRDPEYFPDPEVYRPERFDTPPRPGTYAPFGEGPRICIGKRFALIEMKMAISRIIDSYSLEFSNRTETPIKLSTVTFVPSPQDGLYLKIKKIQN